MASRPHIERDLASVKAWLLDSYGPVDALERIEEQLEAVERERDDLRLDAESRDQDIADLKEQVEAERRELERRTMKTREARVVELEEQLERERKARKAAEAVNADEVIRKRTNLEAMIASLEAERDGLLEQFETLERTIREDFEKWGYDNRYGVAQMLWPERYPASERGEFHAQGLDERGIYGGRSYPAKKPSDA